MGWRDAGAPTLGHHCNFINPEVGLHRVVFLATWVTLGDAIARGEMAIRDGRVLTHAQAKSKMKRWLK
ncbi:MAG: hypothetical protein WCD79_23310 [Chthoniobacteraceae bacterium]